MLFGFCDQILNQCFEVFASTMEKNKDSVDAGQHHPLSAGNGKEQT